MKSEEHLRSLPRVFLPGVTAETTILLPPDELTKLRKVLRLSSGALIAVLPNDGSLLKCKLAGHNAEPLERYWPDSEAALKVVVAQSLPKADKLEEIVRACTELGVARFELFNSERTVVRWDAQKVADKIRRLNAIARETCELSFRTRLPEIVWVGTLAEILKERPDAVVLSEKEGVTKTLPRRDDEICLVVGPEGGWSPGEHELIAGRAVTLGPRVLRVDHAAAAAAAALLLPVSTVPVS